MIYEWGKKIIHIGKTIRHFFRALFCKKYYIGFTLGRCRLTDSFCNYWQCPKVEEKIKKNEQH